MNDGTISTDTDDSAVAEDVVADDYEPTALAVIEEPKPPALPTEGFANYFKPAGEFSIDLSSMHATVSLSTKATMKLTERAKKVHDFDTAMCFIVVVDADGYEYRNIKPFNEGFIPIRVLRPGSYQVLGLILTPEQADFANRYLFKRSVDNTTYAYPAVDWSTQGEPKMVGYATLNWAIQTGIATIEVTEKHVRILDDTWQHRWMSSSVFHENPPQTNLAYYVRKAFAFSVQGPLWLAYMGGKAAYVAAHGVWYSWFKGARGFDWGAILDPNAERSRNAESQCVPYSRADTTAYGDVNVQSAFRRALVPAQWWQGIVSGFLISNIFFAGTMFQEIVWSVVSIVALAFLQFRIADNDGQYTSAWRYLLNSGGGMMRSLRISKLPYVGKYHDDINRWMSAQSAKLFRPVISPKQIKEK
jgi:hypothetical protein